MAGEDPPYPRGHALFERMAQVIPGGTHTFAKAPSQWPERCPRVLVRGSGAWVWDVDGHRYVDWFNGLTTVSLGHGHPAVTQRVSASLSEGIGFQLPGAYELEAAECFLSRVAVHDEMVKFAKDGSTVNDSALRLARAYTGRTLVARCSDQPFFSSSDWFIGATRFSAGCLEAAVQATVGFTYGDDSIDRLLDARGREIAAVILEPVGFAEPPAGYLARVRELCRRHGAVLVFDEVVTGLKHHLHGAGALFGVRPDLTTWGKGIANGFAVSALSGSREIMRLGDPAASQTRVFLLSTTHGAERTGLAAMTATVETFASGDLIERNYRTGRRLREHLAQTLRRLGLERCIGTEGYDCFFRLWFKDGEGKPSAALRTLFLQECIRHGLLIRGTFYPSPSHGEEELELTARALDSAAQVYRQAVDAGSTDGLLEGPPAPLFTLR